MDGHKKSSLSTKRKGKSHLSWRKRQRKLNEPLVKRIQEERVRIEGENDDDTDSIINVLSTSSESINTDSDSSNKSVNFTICHPQKANRVENMASNDDTPPVSDNTYLETCQNELGNNPS